MITKFLKSQLYYGSKLGGMDGNGIQKTNWILEIKNVEIRKYILDVRNLLKSGSKFKIQKPNWRRPTVKSKITVKLHNGIPSPTCKVKLHCEDQAIYVICFVNVNHNDYTLFLILVES